MRSGELIGLTWDCIDFENGIIRITKQLVQPRKKGASFSFGTPKNGKGRILTPAPFVMETLKEHKKEQALHRLKIGPVWNDGGFPNLVFTQPDGSHFCQWTVCRILQKNWLRPASKNTGSMIYAILTSSMLSGLEMT